MAITSDNGVVHLVSTRSVSDALKHLLSLLQAKGITVFAVVDHSGEAAKAGLVMPETKLVIFGNPKAGTPLMLAAPDSAIDLPLKILIAADSSGSTTVSYNSVTYIQSRFALASDTVATIAAIEQIAAATAG